KVFADFNMTGSSTVINVDRDIPNANSIGWNDKISSLYAVIPEGKKLTLFQYANYGGKTLEFGAGSYIVHDMRIHDFNDGTSSIRWDNVSSIKQQSIKHPEEIVH